MPNKRLSIILLTFLFLWLACSGAFAVFRGEPDTGEHPYAGLAYIFIPASNNYTTCSGSLVNAPNDRQVFLTAGHCIFLQKHWAVELAGMSLLMKHQKWSSPIRPLGFRHHSHPTTHSLVLVTRIFLRRAMALGLGVEKGITALSFLITQLRQASFRNLRNFRQLAWWMIYSAHMVQQSSSMALVKNPSLL